MYGWSVPKGVYNPKRGKAELLQRNWKSILYLLDEAQFVDEDTPPKLDERMKELAKKKPDHPAVKAYQRYRGGSGMKRNPFRHYDSQCPDAAF